MPRRGHIRGLFDKLQEAKQGHRLRHTPSGFGAALADRVSYLDSRHWDALTSSASIFLSRDYLEALEATAPAGVQQRYAMIFRDRAPVAAVAAQMVNLAEARTKHDASTTEEGQPKRGAAGRVQAAALKWLPKRMLVCGNLFSWGPHGVAFAPDEDPQVLWPAVAEALYRIRRADKLSGEPALVLIKDLPAQWADGAKRLRQFSYRSVSTDPDMVLEIDSRWRSLDDYVASLARGYRKSAGKIIADVDRAGCVVETITDLRPCAEKLHQLYSQVHHRAATRFATLTPNYLPALAENLGPTRFRCSVIRRDGELLGFVTTLKDGDTAIGYYIGIDYAANAEIPIYFRLLKAVVADSIALDCRRVSLGRTALEPKARLGARPQPLQVWLRHRTAVMNTMLRPLLQFVPHDEPPQRNPFKS